MTRLWTLNEGVLARRFLYQFSDMALSYEMIELLNLLEIMSNGDIPEFNEQIDPSMHRAVFRKPMFCDHLHHLEPWSSHPSPECRRLTVVAFTLCLRIFFTSSPVVQLAARSMSSFAHHHYWASAQKKYAKLAAGNTQGNG
jgi:hypothetical protein